MLILQNITAILKMIKKINEEKEYLLSINENDKTLIFRWKPVYFSQDRFKEIVSQFASYANQNRAKFLQIDARENKVIIAPETQAWHDGEIVPKYIKAGVKKIAFLIPENIFSELTHVKTFSQQNASSQLETKFFKSEIQISEWFNS